MQRLEAETNVLEDVEHSIYHTAMGTTGCTHDKACKETCDEQHLIACQPADT